MWTDSKVKLAALGATVALGMLMPTTPALAAGSPQPAAGATGQTSTTVPDTTIRTATAVSNIMKTKHDTVKNSISNVR
jgi:hypothetical protein